MNPSDPIAQLNSQLAEIADDIQTCHRHLQTERNPARRDRIRAELYALRIAERQITVRINALENAVRNQRRF